MKKLNKGLRNALYLVLMAVVCSCGIQTTHDDNVEYNNLGKMLTRCEGYAIVVTTGYNEGNTKPYRYYIVVRDERGVCLQYYGAKYNVNAGDTLVVKPNGL